MIIAFSNSSSAEQTAPQIIRCFLTFSANQKLNNRERKDLTSGLFDACGSRTTDLISDRSGNPKQRETKRDSLFLTGLISSTLSAKRALKSKALSRCLYQDTLLICKSKNIKRLTLPSLSEIFGLTDCSEE